MTNLAELVKRFCPDGVPREPLGSLGTIVRGKRFVKSDMVSEGVPCLHYGEIYTRYGISADKSFSFLPEEQAASLRFAKPGDVIIVSAGESVEDIGKSVAWLGSGPIVIHDACYAFSSPLDPRFVSYYFSSRLFRDQIRSDIASSKISSVSTQSVSRALIPVPPVEIQREVVRILDNFRELEAQLETELEAELRARKLQYLTYRDSALDYSKDGVDWSHLREVVEIRSGWGFPNAYQGRESGVYPFYKVSDMNTRGNESVLSVANHYIDQETARKLGVKPAPRGTIVFPKIGAAVATNKKRVLSMESAYDNNVMGLIPGPRMMSRFLYHWMQKVDLSSLAHNSGAVPSIRKSEVSELLVPVPGIDEQERIADSLDKFDALINELSVGLPAELAARRKQYEYYRDKLLTFEEAPA